MFFLVSGGTREAGLRFGDGEVLPDQLSQRAATEE
jgi:hypothetical protein